MWVWHKLVASLGSCFSRAVTIHRHSWHGCPPPQHTSPAHTTTLHARYHQHHNIHHHSDCHLHTPLHCHVYNDKSHKKVVMSLKTLQSRTMAWCWSIDVPRKLYFLPQRKLWSVFCGRRDHSTLDVVMWTQYTQFNHIKHKTSDTSH